MELHMVALCGELLVPSVEHNYKQVDYFFKFSPCSNCNLLSFG